MSAEGVLGYGSGCHKLVGRCGVDERFFYAGDALEVCMVGQWQAVRMESGGYKGWYLVTAGGERVRPALCMKARLVG